MDRELESNEARGRETNAKGAQYPISLKGWQPRRCQPSYAHAHATLLDSSVVFGRYSLAVFVALGALRGDALYFVSGIFYVAI